MKDLQNFVQYYIKVNEGSLNTVYLDHLGYKTVGVGHLLPKDTKLNVGDKVLQEQIREWFSEDIQMATADSIKILGIRMWSKLPDQVLIVMIDMMFNLGSPRFSKFKKMIAAIKEGDYNKAADELLDSRYAKQVPNRAKRNAELLRGVK